MPHILVERGFEVPRTLQDMIDSAPDEEGCFGLYMVSFRWSFLATDGSRAVCCFEAPDAESVRAPLRKLGADVSVLWSGTLHDAQGADRAAIASANVLVERSFAQPVTLESIQVVEGDYASCLERHGVKFLRSVLARDGKRMLCSYRAPDAESVRMVQREAQLPFDRIWAFNPIWPRSLARASLSATPS